MSVSLDEALDRFADQTPEERERFIVDDDQKAAWAMRKLRGILAHKAANQAIANEEIARVNDWLASQNASLEKDEQYFTNMLISYARYCRDHDDRKSIVLPHGKVTSRKGQDKWDIDSEAFLKWAEVNNPQLIRTKIEPNLSEAKKVLGVVDGRAIDPTTGEVAAGVSVTPSEISYSVEVEL